MPQPISIHAIYCDDIRNEVGGKVSLMGVYHNEMLFPSFPARSPKLGVRIVVRFPIGGLPRETLSIEVLHEDGILGNMTFDRQALADIPVPSPKDATQVEDQSLSMQVMFLFTPFQVKAPCKLESVVFVDGEEIQGNSLRIRLPDVDERAANGWNLAGN